jgi:transcriptional regulator with XRE-family HTH domain
MAQLGYSIRIIRQARELTSAKLAKKAGISSTYLSLIEAGERVPPAVTLERLATALGVDVEVFKSLTSPTRLISRSERTRELGTSLRRLAVAERELKRKLG